MSNVVSDGILNTPGDTSSNDNSNNGATNTVPNNISSESSELPGFNDEFVRLKSFPYQWTYPICKRELAKNGFYFAGATLPLKCFSCSLEIPVEASSETLPSVHLEWEPSCEFAHGRTTNPRNKPLGDTSDFRYERNRLISFLGANWFPQVDPEDLAKWGFYWTGVADVGRCNFCRLEVRGWEPNDQGRSEHMRWNPHCPFMQNRAVGNVRIGEEASASSIHDDCSNVSRSLNLRSGTSVNVEELGVMLTAPPRHPEYASLSSRQASYSMWPLSMRQRPDQLSEAGFYYTSKGDRVICFQCGGGLKDWGQTDLPWVEHAVWFPRCAYLLMKKGREFVSQVQALKNAQLSNTDLLSMTQSSITSHQPAVPHLQPLTSTQPAALGHPIDPSCATTAPPSTVSARLRSNPTPTAAAAAALAAAAAAASADNNSGSTSAPEAVIPQEQHGTSTSVESESNDARDMRMCKVCYQKELGIVFLPCGHMATCPDCAPQLTSCPICRARTNAYVRAFLP